MPKLFKHGERPVFEPAYAPAPVRDGLGSPFADVRANRITVAALTPVKPGADMDLLEGVAKTFFQNESCQEWHLACAPDDYEIVCEIASEYAPRWNVTTTLSRNVANTRNQLNNAALADYVVQCDADDKWVPGAIDELVSVATKKEYRHFSAFYGIAQDIWYPENDDLDFLPPHWWAEFPDNVAGPGDYARRRQEIAMSNHERIHFGIAYYPTMPASGILNRHHVLDVGGWDVKHGNQMEDTLMIARLQRDGYFYVDPDLMVMYYRKFGKGTLTDYDPTMEQLWELNRRLLEAEGRLV